MQLSLLADNMMMYTEKSRRMHRKALEPISIFSKVREHKIETKKSITLLYTNNEHLETENKSTISFKTKLFQRKHNILV